MGELVVSRDELVRRCRGRRVVLTNGCFDILHVGHVRALKDAAELGELLVVAINDDESVRRLKGAGRPLVPMEERAEILCALEGVDFVHPFPEPDVSALLRALRPAVHAKGSDYTKKTVPERETALEVGAEIAIVGDPKDHSVSDLLERMRGT